MLSPSEGSNQLFRNGCCVKSLPSSSFGDGGSEIRLILGIKVKGEKDIIRSKADGQLAN